MALNYKNKIICQIAQIKLLIMIANKTRKDHEKYEDNRNLCKIQSITDRDDVERIE